MLMAEPAGRAAPLMGDGWTRQRVLVVGLCFLLNMLDGADLLIMSFVAPTLSEQWAVSPERLGVLFSASLAGMAVGCLLVAPLADRFGRRTMILFALALAAGAMIASGFTSNVTELMIARFAVGVGVGTIGVSMTAMAAEFAPPRYESFAVGLVQAGWPFASIITAFAAVAALGVTGWQTLMIAIGGLGMALWAVVFALLPESQPITPAARGMKPTERLAQLFRDGRARASVRLWTAVTLGYFVLYFVISWIPKLSVQAGLAVEDAIYAGATYNLGAFLGTTLVGILAIRFRLRRVIALFLTGAAAAMIVFGGVAMPVWLTLIVAGLVGVSVQGGFNGFWALAARLYPAEMRGTGVGWALGVGRIGAVLGPIVGGLLVGAGTPISAIFLIFAVPALMAAMLTVWGPE